MDKAKYIISIGKRQPMHIGHKRSLEKILAIKDKKLIYVIGSANLKGDPLFDPITNPLNIDQQIEQFKTVFPNENPIFLFIKDVPEMGQWGDILIDELLQKNVKPEECVIHFIGKNEDRLDKDLKFTMKNGEVCYLNRGQWLIEALSHWGFRIWFDDELKTDLKISARNLRKMDLEHLRDEEKQLFAAPEFLKNLALKARQNNLQMNGKPLTLYDLSLQRFY